MERVAIHQIPLLQLFEVLRKLYCQIANEEINVQINIRKSKQWNSPLKFCCVKHRVMSNLLVQFR